jgi:uncharacterized protein (DUF433 family)
MSELFQRITIDPAVCLGQPCLRGLRIPVSRVLQYLAAGKSAPEILEELPELEIEDIQASLHLAARLHRLPVS